MTLVMTDVEAVGGDLGGPFGGTRPDERAGARVAAPGAAAACVAAPQVGEVRRALEVVARHVARGDRPAARSRAEWAGLVTACQSVVNTATAVQDVAITRVVAIEEEWVEDGTSEEVCRAPGHVAVDGPDVVAGALGVSHVHAQRRVALAVRLVVDADEGLDVGDEIGPRPGVGLSGLHAAMLEGVLDAYRAGVVAEELAEAPPEVAEAVVAVVLPHLGVDTPVQLRRRCRRALATISPDLLRQRAKRAREGCGLRRWVAEPGVDRWEGTFPSEQAAQGWAAVDALARRYVAQGRCAGVEAARAVALMDLICGQATIEVQLVVTVPADVVTDSDAPSPDVPDAGSDGASDGAADVVSDVVSDVESVVVSDPGAVVAPDLVPHHAAQAPSHAAASHVADGAGAAKGRSPTKDAARARSDAVEESPTISGSTPRPGQPEDVPVAFGGSAGAGCEGSSVATWPLTVGDEAVSVKDGEDLVEVTGPFPGEPVLVGRAWITSFLRDAVRAGASAAVGRTSRAGAKVRVRVEQCHPATGALLGGDLTLGRSYRPGRRIAALVRARDGRCRFPGCSVAARFCDLDHVRPWPAGPTSPANLICLCRRHHRIKQRAGWSVRLACDGRAVWVDPTGRVRTSWPRDLLDVVVLPAPRASSIGGATPAEAVPAAPETRSTDPTSTPGTRTGPTSTPGTRTDPTSTPGTRTDPTGTSGPGTDPTDTPGTQTDPTSSWGCPSGRAAGETTLEVVLGVLADHDPALDPWNRRGRAAAAPQTSGDPRVQLVRPDPRRPVRYVDDRPCRRRRTRHGNGGLSPGNAADTGPPPF